MKQSLLSKYYPELYPEDGKPKGWAPVSFDLLVQLSEFRDSNGDALTLVEQKLLLAVISLSKPDKRRIDIDRKKLRRAIGADSSFLCRRIKSLNKKIPGLIGTRNVPSYTNRFETRTETEFFDISVLISALAKHKEDLLSFPNRSVRYKKKRGYSPLRLDERIKELVELLGTYSQPVLYSNGELARRLGVSRATIARYLKIGETKGLLKVCTELSTIPGADRDPQPIRLITLATACSSAEN